MLSYVNHSSVDSCVVCFLAGLCESLSGGTDDNSSTLELSFVLYSTDNQCGIVID